MRVTRRHILASSCQTPSVGGNPVRRQSERLIAPHGDRSEGKPRLGGASLALNSCPTLELSFSPISIIVFRLGVAAVT